MVALSEELQAFRSNKQSSKDSVSSVIDSGLVHSRVIIIFIFGVIQT